MSTLIQTAVHVTRDLNPNDNLKNLRIKTSKKEMLVSHSNEFILIVIQAWTPAKEDPTQLQLQRPPASASSMVKWNLTLEWNALLRYTNNENRSGQRQIEETQSTQRGYLCMIFEESWEVHVLNILTNTTEGGTAK